MRSYTLTAILLACLPGPLMAAEKVTLYGDDDYAPYSYVEAGQYKGIYVELIKRAAAKLAPAYEVEVKAIPWKRGLDDVRTGAALGLFPPYLKKDRTFIQPYSTDLYRETVVLFCHDDVMKTPRKKFPDDFTGVTIGINAGFTLSDVLTAAAKSGKVTLQETKGNDANIQKLASKRIGCYANDRLSVLYSVKKMKAAADASADIKALKLNEAAELSAEDAYIGYSAANKATYKADFIQRMNAALEEVKKGGALNSLISANTK